MLNTSKFLERASLIHGDRYIYDQVIYINNSTKIIIKCKIHGEFLQTPKNHLAGQGCKKCSPKYIGNIDDFIEKCKKIHGDKFFYDKVNYVNSSTKVVVTCKIHGDFLITPNNHLTGADCIKCKGNYKSNKKEFISKSLDIHGDVFLYDKVEYESCIKKVIITCKIHGDFKQSPTRHLSGDGCPKCAGVYKSNKEEFIVKSVNIHGDKYCYDAVNYINNKTKIKINCLKHGEFLQTPNHHLKGVGCPSCKKSKGEIKIENILKKNNINYKPQYTFPDLKNKNLLCFDFGIIDNQGKLKYLIEFNGEQHYKIMKYFHKSQKDFELSLYRDNLKMQYSH